MSTRYYLQNAAAPYTPTTKRGAWDKSSATYIYKLGTAKAGAAAIDASVSETNASNSYDVLLARFVSDGLAANCAVNVEDFCIGWSESAATNDMYPHAHIFVIQGDSDNVRGTILTDYLGATEMSTAFYGRASTPTGQSSVNALAGDRIVVELGYQARNTSTSSLSGRVFYGGTNATDQYANSDEYALPGWIDFTIEITSALQSVNGLAKASVQGRNGLALASIKTWNGLA